MTNHELATTPPSELASQPPDLSMRGAILSAWGTVTLVWLPLFVYLLTLGQGDVPLFGVEWLRLRFAGLRFGLGLSWLLTGLLSTAVAARLVRTLDDLRQQAAAAQLAAEKPPPESPPVSLKTDGGRQRLLRSGRDRALRAGRNAATNIALDRAGDLLGKSGNIWVNVAQEAASLGCLMGGLRIVVGLASAWVAALTAAAVLRTGDAHPALTAALYILAAAIAGLQLGDVAGVFVGGYVRLIFAVGLAAYGVGGFSGAATGSVLGVELGLVGIVLGAIVGLVAGILLSRFLLAAGRYSARFYQFFTTLMVSGLMAGLPAGALAGDWRVGLAAGLVAAILSVNLGGGVAGLAGGSLSRPRFAGRTPVLGWLGPAAVGLMNLWVLVAFVLTLLD